MLIGHENKTDTKDDIMVKKTIAAFFLPSREDKIPAAATAWVSDLWSGLTACPG